MGEHAAHLGCCLCCFAREESALAFRVGGNLVRRLVDAGEEVKQGQLLAELDPGDARLQPSAAQADMARLGGDLERYRKLLAQKLISQSAFDAQQAAWRAARAKYELMRNQDDYTRLRAPRDGVIASRQAEAGQVVAAGQTIYRFAGDGAREVAIALPEARASAFVIGQPVEVELWARPGVRMAGRIREISPAADPQSRTYAARVELESAAGEVSLGQSARVHLAAGDAGHRSVPLSAVQRGEDGSPRVWIVADGVARPVAVTLGGYGESRVAVLSGLPADALVIAAGGHLLRDGQPVVPVDRDNAPVEPVQPKPATDAAP